MMVCKMYLLTASLEKDLFITKFLEVFLVCSTTVGICDVRKPSFFFWEHRQQRKKKKRKQTGNIGNHICRTDLAYMNLSFCIWQIFIYTIKEQSQFLLVIFEKVAPDGLVLSWQAHQSILLKKVASHCNFEQISDVFSLW